MRYFLDTEFIEEPGHLDLISIGIAAEDGREFYAESAEVDWSRASQWVLDNVKPHLTGETFARRDIASNIRDFVGNDSAPEFWAYYADYDWVAFCWLFGRMIDLPKAFPCYCRDLKQWMDQLGVKREQLPPDPTDEHHALADAVWTRLAFNQLLQRACIQKVIPDER